MTTMVLAWVVFPLALAAVSLGAGLLVERITGARLPGPRLLPVGFAGVVVVGDRFKTFDWIELVER